MPEAALPSLPELADAPIPAAAPSSATAERAERARRNGACSRGPVTAAGKATASRNALRHGLCAKVHLVLAGEDDDAFTALAADVLAEVAPVGAVESFLATRLAAAMWQTGRADRLEAQAFAAGELPDPDRLRLALRYRGSIGRDLFRTLRELRPHLQAAATARAEVASSPTLSLATPPPTPSAGADDSGPPKLALHTGGYPRDGSGMAGSRPQEDAAAEPGFGAPVDQAPSDPSLDDPTIVLRHGLTLADLLAPDDDACTLEPELALQPADDPIDAPRERATPCADTACTDEPDPSLQRSADLVDTDGQRHRNGAPRRNEPSAPNGDTLEPEVLAGATIPAGSVQGIAGPPLDAWSRMWGLTPPAAPSRPSPVARHERRAGHAVAAHPSESSCHRSGLDAGEPAAYPVLAGSSPAEPVSRAPDIPQPAVAPPDMHRPPRAAEPAGIAPSPPAAVDLPRREAHQPGAHPGSAGRQRRAVSRRHRTPSAWPSGDHRRSDGDPGGPLREAEPPGPASPPGCSGSRPLGSVI